MSSIHQLITELNHIRAYFDKDSLQRKNVLVQQIMKKGKLQPKALSELHECLLFLSAYPHHPAFYETVNRLLDRTAEEAGRIIRRKRSDGLFEHTGIHGTHVKAGFSFELIQWLMRCYPGALKLDSFGADPELVFTLLLPLLPSPLREHFYEGGYVNVYDWLLKQISHDREKQLMFIIHLFENSGMPLHVRNQHFDQLGLCVDADLHIIPARHLIRGRKHDVFYQKEPLIRKVDIFEILNEDLQPLPDPGRKKTRELIRAMRLQLLCLYRETDPATYADENDLQVFHVGRGMDILLIGMDCAHRQPIDAYIGFMAFKNGRPYAYGGAWLLGSNAKIGINIFPSYRGGESAWFFAQLMRVYYRQYCPSCFIAEPYQVGRDNPEGIETGAFWFYYKLGFRPLRKELQKLATTEFALLTAGKLKKSPRKTLEKLVEDEMILACDSSFNAMTDVFDTAGLSTALSAHLRKRYLGDLNLFMEEGKTILLKDPVLSKISGKNKKVMSRETISLYLLAGGGISGWTPDQKSLLGELLHEKTIGTDSAYARLLTRHTVLKTLLLELSKKK